MLNDNFDLVVEDVNLLLTKLLKDLLLAAYLGGSIAYGDAIPYESDLDYKAIVAYALCDELQVKLQGLKVNLQKKYPFVKGINIGILTLDELREDHFSRFIMTYNTNLVLGDDIVASINHMSNHTIKPDLHTATLRLSFAKNAFEEIISGKRNVSSLDILPENNLYAARKLARYLIVIEGAYYLMALGVFKTFQIKEVLDALSDLNIFSDELIETTRSIIKQPIETGIGKEEYLALIKPEVEKLFTLYDELI